MDGIVKSLNQNLEKEETKAGKEKKNNDELNNRYLKLVCFSFYFARIRSNLLQVDKERQFYKVTKEFQEECKLNETMSAKLEQ